MLNIDQLDNAYQTLSKSAGSANREQEAYANSLTGKINALKEQINGLWIDISNSDAIKGVIDALSEAIKSLRESESAISIFANGFKGLLNLFAKASKTFGAFPTLISTISGVLAICNQRVKDFSIRLADSFTPTKKLKEGIASLSTSLKTNIEGIKSNISAKKQLITSSNMLSASTIKEAGNLGVLYAKLGLAKAGTLALQVATQALNIALTMGLSLGITKAMQLFDDYIHKAEKLKESNDNFINSVSDKNAYGGKSIEQLLQLEEGLEKYESLRNKIADMQEEGIDVSNVEDYNVKLTQLQGICDKLIAVNPSLADSFMVVGDAMSLNTYEAEKLSEAQMKLAKADALQTMIDNGVKSKEDIEEMIEKYQEAMRVLGNLEENLLNDTAAAGEKYALKGAKEQAEELKNSLEAVAIASKLLQDENADYVGSYEGIMEVLNSTNEEGENLLQTFNDVTAAEVENQGVTDETAAYYDELKDEVDSATESLKGFQDALSGSLDKRELIQDMMDEMAEYGELTQDTWAKAMTSEYTDLISALGDSTTFMENLQRIMEETNGTIDATAESIWNEADAIENANAALGNTEAVQGGVVDGFNNITEASDNSTNAIIENSDTSANAQIDNMATVTDVNAEDTDIQRSNQEGLENDKISMSDDSSNAQIENSDDVTNVNGENAGIDAQNFANAETDKITSAEEGAMGQLEANKDLVNNNKENYKKDAHNVFTSARSKLSAETGWTSGATQVAGQMNADLSGKYTSDFQAFLSLMAQKNALLNTFLRGYNWVASKINSFSDKTGIELPTVDLVGDLGGGGYSGNSNTGGITTSASGLFENMSGDYWSADGQIKIGRKVNSKYKKTSTNSQKVGHNGTSAGNSSVGHGGGAGHSGGSYNPTSHSGGGSGSGGKGSGGKGSGGSGSDVADVQDLTDRYFELDNALTKVNNDLELNATKQEKASGEDLKKLQEDQVELLNKKKKILKQLLTEYKQESEEIKVSLQQQGVAFDKDGAITNYNEVIKKAQDYANSLSGDSKKSAINAVKELQSQMKRYSELTSNTIPSLTNDIEEMGNALIDVSDAMEGVYENFDSLLDRYYTYNDVLDDINNALELNKALQDNAGAKERQRLISKEIALLQEKKKALENLNDEHEKEMFEIKRSIASQGATFDQYGNISNYNQLLDKMTKYADSLGADAGKNAYEAVKALIWGL